MFIVINAALYQAGWLACTLGAANDLPWVGPVAAIPVVAWHLVRARHPKDELLLVAAAVASGLVFETALLQSGWISYAGAEMSRGLAPLWIVALWGLFATTFNVSLRALRAHPVLAALIGALGGPLAYYAGARLGALTFVSPHPALAAIAIGWAVATPALLATAQRLDGYRT